MPPAFAVENEFCKGAFWINLKTKLTPYLEKNISKSLYSYEVIGPNREMTTFLGNRPDAEVKFERLNLSAPSSRKTLVAYVEDENKKRLDNIVILIDVLTFQKVYMLHRAVSAGQEISPDNIYQATLNLQQMDSKLYFNANPAQKVATVSIPAGTAIKVNMLRHQKLVQVNNMIRVNSGSKMIALQFLCRAVSSGDLGETINVYCADMQHPNHQAVITAQGEAKLI
jgi:flagella basal body P-ring formation protein FlgA